MGGWHCFFHTFPFFPHFFNDCKRRSDGGQRVGGRLQESRVLGRQAAGLWGRLPPVGQVWWNSASSGCCVVVQKLFLHGSQQVTVGQAHGLAGPSQFGYIWPIALPGSLACARRSIEVRARGQAKLRRRPGGDQELQSATRGQAPSADVFCLVVIGLEVGGRFVTETTTFLRVLVCHLARAPPCGREQRR